MNEVTRKEVREEGGYRDAHASENLDRCKQGGIEYSIPPWV